MYFQTELLLLSPPNFLTPLTNKKLLGRVDRVDFPELNLFDIPVKIDTGAYTSAIHCSDIRLENNQLICNFEGHTVSFSDYSLTDVKSSNGFKENRYKIKTKVIFFGKSYRINLTLSTRDDMKFPVLIGRQFLRQKFLVDVDIENQSYKHKANEHSYTFA